MFNTTNEGKVVYWSPYFNPNNDNWNLLFEEPTRLDKVLLEQSSKIEKQNNIFLCPAVSNISKTTFVINNPISSEFTFDVNEEYSKSKIIPISKNYYNSKLTRNPNFDKNILFEYGLGYIFFSEETLNMTLTSPYFSKADHLQYGSIVFGKFNIGKWFRQIAFEFNIWNNKTLFKIEKGENIAYINFESDKPIILKRFVLNDKLFKLSQAVENSKNWCPFMKLKDRYNNFFKTRTNDIIIKEIKKNLI